jgi:predicted nucleic acid-binding protein
MQNGRRGLMIDNKTLKKFARGKRVLVDSNIIIYLTEKTEPYHHLSRELFAMIEEGSATAVFSILSIAEVMHGPVRAGKSDIAIAVKNYLLNFPNSICQDITPDVLDLVGRDGRVNWKSLRAVDSLIIASGLHAGVDLFVSNDRHFRDSLLPDMLVSFVGE